MCERHTPSSPVRHVLTLLLLGHRETGNSMTDVATNQQRPLLDAILDMTSASVSRAGLGDRELMMVRFAALAAVGAPPSSYLLNIAAAVEATDLTLEDARGVLIAVAPIIGTPKVVAAAGTVAEALGLALALEDDLAEEDLTS